ncbi:MAG: 3(or 17)beta-hydroxysteroid dehydrogenase [Oceanicoccus sp.]|jgi:3(or 17)beta-hydroxysteroid dehydrogenase
MGRVEAKIALISGGASGLGLASAKRLSEEGATVVLADVNQQLGEAEAAMIDGASFEVLDVSIENNWVSVVNKIVAEHGRLDILVNCAGIVQLASIEHTTESIWRKINAVGTDGTFFGCKQAVRIMKMQGSGSIINMCSTASIMGGPNIFAYAASKSAIRGMTKSIATLSTQEGYGLRCNSVHPGNISTPMLHGMMEVVRASAPEVAEAMADIWVGEPIDVANMVLFLASDESKAVNGAEMVIDNTVTITEGVVRQ